MERFRLVCALNKVGLAREENFPKPIGVPLGGQRRDPGAIARGPAEFVGHVAKGGVNLSLLVAIQSPYTRQLRVVERFHKRLQVLDLRYQGLGRRAQRLYLVLTCLRVLGLLLGVSNRAQEQDGSQQRGRKHTRCVPHLHPSPHRRWNAKAPLKISPFLRFPAKQSDSQKRCSRALSASRDPLHPSTHCHSQDEFQVKSASVPVFSCRFPNLLKKIRHCQPSAFTFWFSETFSEFTI